MQHADRISAHTDTPKKLESLKKNPQYTLDVVMDHNYKRMLFKQQDF